MVVDYRLYQPEDCYLTTVRSFSKTLTLSVQVMSHLDRLSALTQTCKQVGYVKNVNALYMNIYILQPAVLEGFHSGCGNVISLVVGTIVS